MICALDRAIISSPLGFLQGRYGTRSTAVVAVRPGGDVEFYEAYLETGVWKDHAIRYQIGR